jgi:hypothetical protein
MGQRPTDLAPLAGRLLPSKPGIADMMSASIYLLVPGKDRIIHAPPHLMLYAPYATDEDIRLPPATAEMPHVIRPGQPDAYIIVIPGRGSRAGH